MQTIETVIYASAVINGQPENFTALEVNGVRSTGELVGDRQEVTVDNANPEFFSAYLRYTDGKVAAIADFGTHAEAAQYGAGVARQYGWTFTDAFVETHH